MHESHGFTLVEVLTSVVIISIIFISIFHLFTFTTKTANSNKSKLVTTHLAKATIERIKTDHESFFPQEEISEIPKTYDRKMCETIETLNCSQYEFIVNDTTYEVEITFSQDEQKEVETDDAFLVINEKELNLINVLVYVYQVDNEKINSEVEGYVLYVPTNDG